MEAEVIDIFNDLKFRKKAFLLQTTFPSHLNPSVCVNKQTVSPRPRLTTKRSFHERLLGGGGVCTSGAPSSSLIHPCLQWTAPCAGAGLLQNAEAWKHRLCANLSGPLPPPSERGSLQVGHCPGSRHSRNPVLSRGNTSPRLRGKIKSQELTLFPISNTRWQCLLTVRGGCSPAVCGRWNTEETWTLKNIYSEFYWNVPTQPGIQVCLICS